MDNDKVLRMAIRAANRRLPFSTTIRQNAMLENICADFAEAYRIGAEEAQNEIVARLLVIKAREEKAA